MATQMQDNIETFTRRPVKPDLGGLHRCWHVHEAHVTAVVTARFAALRQIRSVRRSLSRHALLTLVRALIVSKVDYCNSVLAGIPGQLQDRLQSVLNAATLLVFSARRSERITPLLRELHWLRDPERVTLQLCVLAYRGAVFMEQRRRTLLRAFSGYLTSTLDIVCVLLTEPSWWYHPPDVQRSVTVPSQWLRHVRGTACNRLSRMHHRWLRSVTSWIPHFSGRRLTMTRRSWLYCTV